MDVKIVLSGDRAVCVQDGKEAFSTPLPEFLARLADRSDVSALPEPIPEGMRFIRKRGDAAVVVYEDKSQVRTVRWLADDSPVPFGSGAVYRTVRLAFPFVIFIIVFRGGRLTGVQQCFYRVEPISSLNDPLFFPNLYNCARTPPGRGHLMESWLCLANLKTDLGRLTWEERTREIHHHVWGASFNRSSEIHEGNSLWQTMKPDARVSTVERWVEESRKDPYFVLSVPWRPFGKTVGQAAEEMLSMVAPCHSMTDAASLVSSMLNRPSRRRNQLMEMFQDVVGGK